MATEGLSAAQKKKIRESLRSRIRTKSYKKGYTAQKTGQKVSDIKVKKGVKKDLGKQLSEEKISQKVHDTRVAKRAFRKEHKGAMKESGTLKKMSSASAKTGAKVASAKAEGKTPVTRVKSDLKGKFKSAEQATKWGSAKTKQLKALKRAGKLTGSQYTAKMGKVKGRTTRGETKKYT